MKSALLTATLAVVAGCSGHVRVQPAVADVHRVAVVSAYANKDVYNVENADAGAAAALLKAMLPSTDAGELEMIAAHAVIAVAQGLEPAFEVLDPQVLVADPAYRSLDDADGGDGVGARGFAKLAQAMVATPPGMLAIPVDGVLVPRGTISLGSDKQAREEASARLGQLARDLGVDAVALVEVDLAYKRGWMSFSFLGNTSARAKPSVATTVALVDQHGNVVVQTPLLARGADPRSMGKGVWMLKDGAVDLTQRSDKVVASFEGAIDDSLARFEKALDKKLGDGAPAEAEVVSANP